MNAKVTGLLHLTRNVADGDPGATDSGPRDVKPGLAEEWILARIERARGAARETYRTHRLSAAGPLLTAAIDDFARYAAVAADRYLERKDPEPIRLTVAAVLAGLADGFGPVCPYLLERLADRTREQAARSRSELQRGPCCDWLADLVDHLGRRRKDPGALRLGSSDPQVLDFLRRGYGDLAGLVRAEVGIVDVAGSGEGSTFGPCVVLRVDAA